jgi:hypothetical protein
MDEAPLSRSRPPVIARGWLSAGDTEWTLTGGVQQFQVGERASATSLEWDDGLNHPPIFFVDELTASLAFAFLLLPESLWVAALLQPLQHPRAFALREVRVPSRIEWVSVRFDSDVSDDPSV